MAIATEPTVTVSIRVPASLCDELDAIVKATGRNRNHLTQEALRRFVDAGKRQVAVIEERIRQTGRGEFATDEQMRQLWAEFDLDLEDGTEHIAN